LDTSGRRSAAQGKPLRFIFRAAFLTPLHRPLLAGQLPQTSYQSLQTPYSFIGLGRTNNYIESLFVGSTSHAPEHFINMEGVVPNSKVVIKPPPVVMVDINDNNGGGGNETHQPQLQAQAQGNWKKRLYLRPGNWIPWVTLTVVGTMLVISLIVLMLHIHEKVNGVGIELRRWVLILCLLALQREDEAERRKASRMINFDAL
jgi:integrin alpha FG-GAP repeat containing protein 1